jgi:hypothetical protein
MTLFFVILEMAEKLVKVNSWIAVWTLTTLILITAIYLANKGKKEPNLSPKEISSLANTKWR